MSCEYELLPREARKMKYVITQVSGGESLHSIRIYLLVQACIGSCWDRAPNAVIYGTYNRVSRSTISGDQSCSLLVEELSRWGVAESLHAPILKQVTEFVDKGFAAVVTVRLSTAFIYHTLKEHKAMIRSIKQMDLEQQHIQRLGLELLKSIGDSVPCPICLDMISESQARNGRVIRIPCSHVYHRDCLLPWFAQSHMCPVCRYPKSQARPGWFKRLCNKFTPAKHLIF